MEKMKVMDMKKWSLRGSNNRKVINPTSEAMEYNQSVGGGIISGNKNIIRDTIKYD